jgi:hypothetical protein
MGSDKNCVCQILFNTMFIHFKLNKNENRDRLGLGFGPFADLSKAFLFSSASRLSPWWSDIIDLAGGGLPSNCCGASQTE